MSAVQVSISQALPYEVLTHIFYFLDAPSLSACSITSKALQQLIERRLWKQISQRDYLPFLCQASLESQDLAFPIRESDIQVQKEYFADAKRTIQELKTGKYNQVEGLEVHVRDWKGFYSQKYEAIDLNGYWVGDYGKGSELVRIYQNGYHLVAKKLTGDTNVPSGKITWEMHLDGSLKKGKGRFQLTEANYENPKLVQAYLQVISKNIVKITWLFQHARGNWYTVTFTNVRAGCGNFEEKTMSRKIDLLKLEKDSDNWVDDKDKKGQSL